MGLKGPDLWNLQTNCETVGLYHHNPKGDDVFFHTFAINGPYPKTSITCEHPLLSIVSTYTGRLVKFTRLKSWDFIGDFSDFSRCKKSFNFLDLGYQKGIVMGILYNTCVYTL